MATQQRNDELVDLLSADFVRITDLGAWLGSAIETGAWTPVLSDSNSGGNLASTTVKNGFWARSGPVVLLNFRAIGINTAGLTASSPLWIQGVPFPLMAMTGYSAIGAVSPSFITYSGNLAADFSGGTAFRFVSSPSGGPSTSLLVSALTSGSAALRASLVYVAG